MVNTNRNWVSWLALAVAGLALVVAFAGRGGPRMMSYGGPMMAAPSGPQAFDGDRFGREMDERMRERMQEGMRERMDGFAERFQGHGQWREGEFEGWRGQRGGGFFSIFFWPFALLGGLMKLAFLGLFVWLLVKLFRQRRPAGPAGYGPPPVGPNPYAGGQGPVSYNPPGDENRPHDPRVE